MDGTDVNSTGSWEEMGTSTAAATLYSVVSSGAGVTGVGMNGTDLNSAGSLKEMEIAMAAAALCSGVSTGAAIAGNDVLGGSGWLGSPSLPQTH
jgi:hypothetical protein